MTKTVCSGAMRLRVKGEVRAEASEKQPQNIRISHPEKTHSKHSFSTFSYSLYHKTNKALDEFANAVVLLCIQYCAKHTIQNVMRLKVNLEKLG